MLLGLFMFFEIWRSVFLITNGTNHVTVFTFSNNGAIITYKIIIIINNNNNNNYNLWHWKQEVSLCIIFVRLRIRCRTSISPPVLSLWNESCDKSFSLYLLRARNILNVFHQRMTQQNIFPCGLVVMRIDCFEMFFDIFVKILLSAKYVNQIK